ncbi:ABC transporter substrate-binding protein [uncultured Cohaesibacter sp.]|uniref:ABC transporter substrate-binding protein n=1 Tax=uncultured Cohaesibacter sp. TaxID=1002546 RepID=UPI00292DA3AB|nr:ABC transporter substrate-binding protein [uncultured Cohaesibacter sp.]
MKLTVSFIAAALLAGTSMASAADLEVMHWWTSGGEAKAVAEFAKAFNATGNHWVDAAFAGPGEQARAIMVSRITGGDPMGAFQFNHGRQAEDLIEAGYLRDLTDIAEEEGWKDIITPSSLLDACTVDGKIYCVPVNIHSWQWLWLSNKTFNDAGIAVPTNWDEFVAAAPKLEAAGKIPMAMGKQSWQQTGAFNVLLATLVSDDIYNKVFADKDAEVAAGPEVFRVFKAAADTRELTRDSNVQAWNEATEMLIKGQAGGQIMGDWIQAEFRLAGMEADKDYGCLPGLGMREVLSVGGNAFYFPKLEDPELQKAQADLARTLLKPDVQVAFNMNKGSLPVRSDVDMKTANACMQKGLKLLAQGRVLQDPNLLLTQDTITQIDDLFAQFFADTTMSPESAQEQFADIIAEAE